MSHLVRLGDEGSRNVARSGILASVIYCSEALIRSGSVRGRRCDPRPLQRAVRLVVTRGTRARLHRPPRFNDYPLVPQCDLGRAIGADLRKAVQVAVFDRGAVVASAEGAVTDHSAIAPSLGGCDVPDVLVLALQAERILRAKLLSHAGSLPSRGLPSSAGPPRLDHGARRLPPERGWRVHPRT